MSKALYPVEVQVLLFRQLLAYETLLKPECRLSITKFCSGTLFVSLIKKGSHATVGDNTWEFIPSRFPTPSSIDTALAIFWQEVPQNFKIQH